MNKQRHLHGHWAGKAKHAKRWIAAVGQMVTGAHRPKAPLKKAKLTLVRYAYRKMDFDGLVSCFKCVVDGLTQCGVLEDDSWKVTGAWNVFQGYAPKGQDFILVRVEEDPNADL